MLNGGLVYSRNAMSSFLFHIKLHKQSELRRFVASLPSPTKPACATSIEISMRVYYIAANSDDLKLLSNILIVTEESGVLQVSFFETPSTSSSIGEAPSEGIGSAFWACVFA